MRRVSFWLRWSWRDLRRRSLQVVAIAVIIGIGTGMYAGLSATSAWRRSSYDESYAALDAHDVRVALTTGTFTTAGRLLEVLAGSGVVADAAVERLVVPTQVDASTGDQTILVAGRLIGVDLADGGPSVDRVAALEGRTLTEADRGADTAVLDVHFGRHYDLPATGTVQLAGDHTVEYVGLGLAPDEFMILTDTGSALAEASLAVVYTSLETAQALGGRAGEVNELVLRLPEGTDRIDAAAAIAAAFAADAPDLAVDVTPLDEERVYRLLYDDIDGDQRFYEIFAFLVLAGAAFSAFNLVGRMVESQRREIGVGMAMGVEARALTIRPLLAAAQIAFFGVVVGVGFGLVINRLMGSVLEQFLPLPVWNTSFQWRTYAIASALGLVLPFLASLWPVMRAVRVPPVDALRTAHLASRGGALAPVLRRLRLPGRTLAQMPLRDVVRAPRRTVLTAMGIAVSVATLVAVIGIVDTFLAAIDRGRVEILAGHPERMTVDLDGFYPLDAPPALAVTEADTIAQASPMLRTGGTLSGGDTSFDVFLTLLDFEDPLWHPTAIEGTLESSGAGLVISEKASDDLGVGVGDDVTLRHPRREGLTGYSMVESDIPVIAIHPNPYRFLVYMDIANAEMLGLVGVANMFQVVPADGSDAVDVQRELFGQAGIAAVQPVTVVVDAIQDVIGQVLDILDVVRGAVVLLALLIAFNSSSISADERRRQHATMFAFGVPVRTVVRLSMTESFFIGVLGTAVGIGLGLVLVRAIVETLIPASMPDVGVDVSVSAGTVVTAALLGVVAVTVAPLLTARRLRRMRVPETLRVQE
jgi:putative ABC transport system permease protein